jgi:hypothetical protein
MNWPSCCWRRPTRAGTSAGEGPAVRAWPLCQRGFFFIHQQAACRGRRKPPKTRRLSGYSAEGRRFRLGGKLWAAGYSLAAVTATHFSSRYSK